MVSEDVVLYDIVLMWDFSQQKSHTSGNTSTSQRSLYICQTHDSDIEMMWLWYQYDYDIISL